MLPVVSTTNRTLASDRLTAARPPPIAGSAAASSSSTPIADQRTTPSRWVDRADPVQTRRRTRDGDATTSTGTGTRGSNVSANDLLRLIAATPIRRRTGRRARRSRRRSSSVGRSSATTSGGTSIRLASSRPTSATTLAIVDRTVGLEVRAASRLGSGAQLVGVLVGDAVGGGDRVHADPLLADQRRGFGKLQDRIAGEGVVGGEHDRPRPAPLVGVEAHRARRQAVTDQRRATAFLGALDERALASADGGAASSERGWR